MGKEIVYCAACGKALPESEFARGRARTVDHSPYCSSCRPAGPATPRGLLRVAAAAVPKAPPPPSAPAPTRLGRKQIAILAGTGAAVLASLAVVLVLVGRGGAPPVAATTPAEPPPAPSDPAPRVLRELESFAASSDDAEAILARCVEARPSLRGKPEEAALRKIEDRALQGIEEKERLERLRIEVEKKARETAAAPAAPAPLPPAPAPAPAAPPANLPPAVALASPRDGATFASPAEVTIVAEASDADGKVSRVEFFLELVKLGEATQAPYSFTKALALPGTYVLSAKSFDDAGAESSSAPVTITVTAEKENRRGPFKGTAASVPGTIRAADYDEGGEGVAFHLLSPGPKDGPPRAGDADSGAIALKPGEWLEYTIRVPASGTYAIEVQASSKGPGGLFHLEFGRNDKTGPLAVPDTGGDRAWKGVSKPAVVLELGEQAMRLVLDKAGPSGGAVHFLSVRISASEAPVVRKPDAAKVDPRKPARPDPMQIKVDEAVRKGLQHLKGLPNIHPQYKEIVLLTYLHAGVPENDPPLQALLKESLAFKPDGYSARTYNISLLAMALEELDRAAYQKDLARCAQFLIDNECRNGQWSYGEPTTFPKDFPTTSARSVATPSKSKAPAGARGPNAPPAARVKPPVRSNLKVKPQREGPDHGDDSNAQYAALGLRACHEAGILLPKESVERARKWWVEFQEPEDPKKKESRDVATGAAIGTPRGWGYLSDGKMPAPGYYGATGSMTAGAVGAVCIYDFILGLDWKRDPSVRDGLAWMAEHFTVKGNPGKETPPVPRADWHYYYLYALERVGMLVPTQHLGRADWYLEGARHLVEAQLPDGSWNQSTYHNSPAVALDTCYAILFLRRVTRPLQDVATVDPFRKP